MSQQRHTHDDQGHSHDQPREHPATEDRAHGHQGLGALLASFIRPHNHDASESINDALQGSKEGIRAVKVSLVGLGITALFQLLVVFLSGSVALLADTIHNFSDASTAIPLWLAFSLGSRPSNRRYTYGYGRAEDLAGVFVLFMIAGSAAVAAYQSFQRLIYPQPLTYLEWVAAAALVGFIGNEVVAQYRIRAGERIGSAALVADGYHARTDGFTSLAVLLGAAGVWLGFPQADPLVGLAITVAILFVLKNASVQVWHRVMDAIDPEILALAESATRGAEGVQEVTAVRARWIGHSLHAEVHIIADCDLKLSEAHAVAERARHVVLHTVPKLADVVVHVDPCGHDGSDPHADLAHHDRRPTVAHSPAMHHSH